MMNQCFLHKLLGVVAALSLCHLATLPPCHAEVPRLIRYQGQAVDSLGVPLEGPYSLAFRLYTVATGGSPIWSEVQPNISFGQGHFSVLLGQVTPFGSLDWSQPLWLGVQVNADPELSPRQQMTSVPLAIRAEKAAQLTQPITPALITPQGPGSGLDADMVDGKQASDLLSRPNHTGTQPPSTISPQGPGSGLDADTVDGYHASQLKEVDSVCAAANEGTTISASCPSGKVFRVISAFYACTTSGSCPDPEIGSVGGGSCTSALNCVGNNSCAFVVGNGQCGGDPCHGTTKRLFLFGLCM